MSTHDQTNNPIDEPLDDTPVLAWSVHLARSEPRKLAVVIVMGLVAALCAYSIFSILGALVVSVAFIASLSDFLFPVQYELTREKATCRRKTGITEIAWDKVKKCYLDEFGVKLSPLLRKTRLEAYRGVYLRFGSDNKDQVIEAVKSIRGK